MSRDFDERYPRFRIGPYDRVTIRGVPFRRLQQTDEAFVLQPTDGKGLPEPFPFALLNALSEDGQVRQDLDFFLPPAMRTPGPASMSGDRQLALLTDAQRSRIAVRYALVQGFKELRDQGQVLMTEASVNAAMDRIRDLARPYLRDTVYLADLDRDARVAAGEGRRRAGGTIEPAISRVHPRTLLNWVRAEKREGKLGLVDGFANRGYRRSGLGHEASALLMAEVRKSYLDRNEPTIAKTVEDVKNAFRKENERRQETVLPCGKVPPLLDVPSRKAVRKCIASLEVLEVTVARKGADAAMKLLRPVGRGLEVARPLERVEIDEWKIDLTSIMGSDGLLALFTAEELIALGLDDSKARWYLTVAIDCRTRVILGMILTRNPKTSAAIACLRMITSDKGAISDATGAACRWSQYGTPELLAADNGGAFKAGAFTDACNDLGTTLERTIAGTPSMRGTIERLFRTCAISLLPRLSGRTFSSVVERAGHPSEARACLGAEDLCFVLVRWIVDIYHNTPHAGLGGRTPLGQWEADHREGNYPLRPAPDRRTKRLAFGIRASRMARKDGIVVLGVRYHSEALAAFVMHQGQRPVDVRWDPEDIGMIEACIDGAWQEVPAVQPGFDRLNSQVWLAARRALRTSSPRQVEWEAAAIADAIEAIKALNQHRSLQFGLIDKGFTAERLGELERSMFASFKVTETRPKLQNAGGPGRSFVPVPPAEAAPPNVPGAVHSVNPHAREEGRPADVPPASRGQADAPSLPTVAPIPPDPRGGQQEYHFED
jgi:putative transposase